MAGGDGGSLRSESRAVAGRREARAPLAPGVRGKGSVSLDSKKRRAVVVEAEASCRRTLRRPRPRGPSSPWAPSCPPSTLLPAAHSGGHVELGVSLPRHEAQSQGFTFCLFRPRAWRVNLSVLIIVGPGPSVRELDAAKTQPARVSIDSQGPVSMWLRYQGRPRFFFVKCRRCCKCLQNTED